MALRSIPATCRGRLCKALGKLTVYDRTPSEAIVARASGHEIVLTNKAPLRADVLAQLPSLAYVGVLATGYDMVDIVTAKQRGVVVTNVPTYCIAPLYRVRRR
jgi:glycerate dehydrogenase